MDQYTILTGAGTLYVAAQGTSAPAVNATPSASWTNLGEFKEEVKITAEQSLTLLRTKNRTGAVKAVRNEESISVEATLAESTLENLSKFVGNSVVDTPPGSGTIGTRKLQMHRGGAVTEYTLLFRGNSPYGAWNAQFYIPRGVFDGPVSWDPKQADYAGIPVKFSALEDFNAATEAERFGYLEVQDAAAL